MNSRASILIGLLWCVALLSVLVVGVLHSARLDLLVGKNYTDRVQAYYLALAGVEKAKALLYHDAIERRRSAVNHSAQLFNAPTPFKDVPLGRGQFRVFRQARIDEEPGIVFGVSDEESRLNLNHSPADAFEKLYGFTKEMAAAILDFRDEDSTVTPGGAEAEDYAMLQPRYLPRNGPLETDREALLVRGLPRDQFLGEDANQNGLLDPNEDDGTESYPADTPDGVLDAGWSGYLTVHSAVANRRADGEPRLDIKSADEAALTAVPGISSDIAKAIVAYRGQNQFENLADLLNVTPPRPAQPAPAQSGTPAPSPSTGPARPSSSTLQRTQSATTAPAPSAPPSSTGSSSDGPKLISQELLVEIADALTVDSQQTLQGPVNINSAPVPVLSCLPGISRELAQAILSYRQSSGPFKNIAALLNVPGMTREIFAQAGPRITARSETFRILSEGQVTSTGARQRLEVIVRVGRTSVETLAYREDL